AATPIFARWFEEASRLPGYLPEFPGDERSLFNGLPSHVWQWDGQDLIDPREAQSRATALEYGFGTHARFYAKQGLDVDEEFEAEAKALGMTLEEYQEALRQELFGGVGDTPAAGMVDEPSDKEREANVAA